MPSFIDACSSVLSIMSGGSPQAAFQLLDGAAALRQRLRLLQPLERQQRRRDRIAQLVGDEAQVLGGLPLQLQVALFDCTGRRRRRSPR